MDFNGVITLAMSGTGTGTIHTGCVWNQDLKANQSTSPETVSGPKTTGMVPICPCPVPVPVLEKSSVNTP